MYYSGIDLHKDNSYITILDNAGRIVKQERLVNDNNAAIIIKLRSIQKLLPFDF